MGFCLFNNVAVAAAEANAQGLSRVLCVDWDVHHGNGTQHSFYGSRELLFLSTHQFPFYPGTGDVGEVGAGEGEGFTVNVPLKPGARDGDFVAIFEDLLMPIADDYRPELVLVSAGFDAHVADPLGGMEVSTEGFAALCGAVKRVAERHAGGKLVLTLEGGYDLDALAESAEACIRVLAGETPPAIVPAVSPRVARVIGEVSATQRRYWSL
jgi:acetoin utilization deacetylase AcuC-like enzyme